MAWSKRLRRTASGKNTTAKHQRNKTRFAHEHISTLQTQRVYSRFLAWIIFRVGTIRGSKATTAAAHFCSSSSWSGWLNRNVWYHAHKNSTKLGQFFLRSFVCFLEVIKKIRDVLWLLLWYTDYVTICSAYFAAPDAWTVTIKKSYPILVYKIEKFRLLRNNFRCLIKSSRMICLRCSENSTTT